MYGRTVRGARRGDDAPRDGIYLGPLEETLAALVGAGGLEAGVLGLKPYTKPKPISFFSS